MLTASNIRMSAEDILSKVTQEQIMEYYLGFAPTNKLVVNPLRRDDNPGCSFYKNNAGTLYFRDWAKDQV